jgi:WD40 repeat protein
MKRLFLPDNSEIQPVLDYGHCSDISALTVSGFSYLLSGSFDTTIKIWNLYHNTCVNTLIGHTARIAAIVVDNDGKEIYSGSDDRTVIVWDFNSGLLKHTLKHDSPVHSLATTRNKPYLIVGCEDGSIHLWDRQSMQQIHVLQMEDDVTALAVTSNDHYLIAGTSQGNVAIWELHEFKPIKTFHYPGSIVKIQQNSQHIYLGLRSGDIVLLEVETFRTVKTISTSTSFSDFYIYGGDIVLCHLNMSDSSVCVIDQATGNIKQEITQIGWARVIASYLGYCMIGSSKGYILWTKIGTDKREVGGVSLGQDDRVQCVKLSSDRQYLIAGYYRYFRIFDLHTGKFTEFEDESNIIDVDFTTDGQYAFAESYEGKVYQVALPSQQLVKEYPLAHLGRMNTLTMDAEEPPIDVENPSWSFEPDRVFFSIRTNAGIHYFHEIAAKELKEMMNKKEEAKDLQGVDITAICNKAKVRYMYMIRMGSYHKMSSKETEIILVDMYKNTTHDEEPQIVFHFGDDDGLIEDFLVAGKSGYLVTRNIEGKIGIYDIATQKRLKSIGDSEQEFGLKQIAFYNENIILAGCVNGKIKLWNINRNTTEQQLTDQFTAHHGTVTSLSVSADGKLIVSGGSSDGIKIWSIDGFELLASLIVPKNRDFAIFTPSHHFYVSDPQLLKFYKVTGTNDASERTLISDEESRQEYLRYFANINDLRLFLDNEQGGDM